MFQKSNKVLDIFEKQSLLCGCGSIQTKKKIHSNRKFGSYCFCKIKKPNKNFLKIKCDWWCLYFDTTDEYRTLSTYITPKTISRRNQKTNTTPQMYCTLSHEYVNQNLFPTRTKNWHDTTALLEKRFLQPTRSECIHFSDSHSVHE